MYRSRYGNEVVVTKVTNEYVYCISQGIENIIDRESFYQNYTEVKHG